MNAELRELYQSLILDHYKKPRNFHEIADTDHSAEGYNPLCGDRVHVFLKLEGDVVKEVSFVGSGCAICMASASLMTEALKDKTRTESEALFQQLHDLVTGNEPTPESDELPAMRKLKVFAGVREFPIRVKCATLPWHTFRAALQGEKESVSTE